eukprot:NODE_249_length_11770_cov_0.803530.p1 type:complete len:1200 gc:universal NODE_249_length_11770_cov_0.803530:2536-6135(+)
MMRRRICDTKICHLLEMTQSDILDHQSSEINPTSNHSLYLKRIVVENFKSYFGRHIVGDFDQQFTSIVGSNGSGKSNIIDSLLFVFGFRSNYLRHQKLSNLIYSGHVQCDFCVVELHFVHESTTDYIISRKVDLNSQSTYYINGKSCPFKVVRELVTSWGIDLDHNRFMILQGEIESIAQMKPIGSSTVAGIPTPDKKSTGLLEYLEDIIGTTEFHNPLFETFNRVQELDTQREVCLRQVNQAEKDRNELQAPFDEAIEYIAKQNEVTELQNMLFQQQKMLQLEAIENLQNSMEKLELNIKENEAKKVLLHKNSESITSEMNAFLKNHQENENVVVEMKKRVLFLEKELVKTGEELKHSKLTLKKKRSALEDAQTKLGSLNLVNDDTIEALKQEIKSIEEHLKDETKLLNKMRIAIRKELEPIEKNCDAIEKELNPIQLEIDSKKNKMQVIAKEYTDLQKLWKESTQGDQNNLIADYENQIASKKEEIEYLNAQIPESNFSISKLRNEITQIEDRKRGLVNESESIRAKLEDNNSEQAFTQSQDQTSKSLYNLKQQIRGIHGKLGDLGVIESKYDIAVSTAAPSLHNFVVQTVQDANSCVQFLRERNLGRTTFIVLDKQNSFNNHKITTPENVPRLIDLIQCAEAHKPAFYFSVRDTIVAKDIDQARRISNFGGRRWRVVTLDGKMIEPTGVMSGGGNRSFSGAMRTSEGTHKISSGYDSAEVKKLEKLLEKQEVLIKKIDFELKPKQDQLKTLLDNVHDLIAVQDELKEELRQIELKRDEIQISVYTEADETRKNSLEEQRKLIYKEIQSLTVQSEPYLMRLQSARDLLKKTGGAELNQKETRVKDLESSKKSLTQRLNVSKQEKVKYEKDFKRFSRDKDRFNVDVHNLEKQIVELEKNDSLKSIELKKLKEDLVLRERNFEEQNVHIIKWKEDIGIIEKELNMIRKTQVDYDNQLDIIKREGRASEKELRRVEELIGKLEMIGIDKDDDEMEVDNALKCYTGDELDALDPKSASREIKKLQETISKMKPNLRSVEDYRQRQKILKEKQQILDECKEKRNSVRAEFEALKSQRLGKFMNGFNIITKKLKEIYSFLTMGGNAELDFVDSLDPFSEGIHFSVMPPKKSWKLIGNLSGGEKTLSSLALVYALHHFKPCPIYVMDEIGSFSLFRCSLGFQKRGHCSPIRKRTISKSSSNDYY